jgi:hypothetical protein
MTSFFAIERELRRLDVDREALGALVSTAPMTAEALRRWLQWLPTGLGHAEFMRRLRLSAEEGGPGYALVHPDLPVADPTYRDPEIDTRLELHELLDLVVWPVLEADAPPNAAIGFDFSHGEQAALANLRRLPHGATADAVRAALAAPMPEPVD